MNQPGLKKKIMNTMEEKTKIPVVVVYRVSERAKTHKMIVFTNHLVDDIISTSRRKPLLPYEYVFDEVCVGSSCIDYYKKKYKIKNHETA